MPSPTRQASFCVDGQFVKGPVEQDRPQFDAASIEQVPVSFFLVCSACFVSVSILRDRHDDEVEQ